MNQTEEQISIRMCSKACVNISPLAPAAIYRIDDLAVVEVVAAVYISILVIWIFYVHHKYFIAKFECLLTNLIRLEQVDFYH